MGVAAGRAAVAEPAERHARLVAHAEGERAADGDGQHRGEVRDHRDRAEPDVAEVDVAVAPARRAAGAAEVLGDDAPGRHAAHDVHAEVALGRAGDVLCRHRPGHAHGRRLVAAARVERPRDPALAVQGVPALLDGARQQHRAVHTAQHRFVEAAGADWVVTARALAHDRHDPHRSPVIHAYAIPSPRARARRLRPRARARMLRACCRGRARATAPRSAPAAAGAGASSAGVPVELPEQLPRLRPARCIAHCPACGEGITSLMQITCSGCGERAARRRVLRPADPPQAGAPRRARATAPQCAGEAARRVRRACGVAPAGSEGRISEKWITVTVSSSETSRL